MVLKVDYKDLRVDIRKTLALCEDAKIDDSNDILGIDVSDFLPESTYFDCNSERVKASAHDSQNIYSLVYPLYQNVIDYLDDNFCNVYNLFSSDETEYRKVLRQIEKFREYYEKLANNTEKYDDNNKKLNNSKVKKELKKNLKNGDYKKATLNYRTLINLYGVKKAKSIVKKVSKGTKANFKFVHEEKYITYVVNHKKDNTGKKKTTKEKFGNVYSIKAKESNSGSSSSTGAKKTKKSKTKTVTKKKK